MEVETLKAMRENLTYNWACITYLHGFRHVACLLKVV